LAAGEAPVLPQRMRDELVDVNGDGLVDSVYFQQQTGAPLPPPALSEPCFSDSFWRACGPLPPEPEQAVDFTQCNDTECYLKGCRKMPRVPCRRDGRVYDNI
jgi:hypothetical protein